MLAVCLALSARGVWSLVWAATSGWGMVGIMLCGRRKMFLMLPVFLGVLGVFYLYGSRRSVRRFREFVIPAAVAVLVGIFLYERVFPSETVGAYYFQYRGDPIAERMKSQGFVAVVETYRQAGFLGAGLGTATQGTQHIQCERPRTWQESGLSRIMVELGVPGLVAFSFIGFALLAACARLLRAMNPRLPDYGFSSGLASMLLANGGSYMVSHQVFGDPFVASLMSFFVGLLLSRGRLYFLPPSPERPAPVPPRRGGSGLERPP